MKAAIIENGVVVNVIEVDSLDALPDLDLVLAPDNVAIGGSFATGVFSPPSLDLEETARNLRDGRNQQLAETDWTQEDGADVDQEAWEAYRQELRDVTLQSGFPEVVVWPISPSEKI